MLYNPDFKRIVSLLLPVRLRKPKLVSYLYVAVAQIQGISRTFDVFRQNTDYRLSLNSQVCHIRAVLNDRFDPAERRIYIDDVSSMPEKLLHRRSTSLFLTVGLRPDAVVINHRNLGGFDSYDFVVVIPSELKDKFDEVQMRAIIDTYKLAGKRYLLKFK